MRYFNSKRAQRGWFIINPFLALPIRISYDGALANEADEDDVFLLETTDVFSFRYVTMLLHADDNNLADVSQYARPITKFGGIGVASPRYGAGAISFNGVNSYLSTTASTIHVAASKFVLEGWVNLTSYQNNGVIFSGWGISGQRALELLTTSTGELYFRWTPDGTTEQAPVYAPTTLSLGTWAHFAIVRSGNALTCYINGEPGFSKPITSSIFDALSFNIGRGVQGVWYLDGLLDDLRATVGASRYGAFALPSEHATNSGDDPLYADVSVLLQANGAHDSTAFTDNSINSVPITAFGNAKINGGTFKHGIGSVYLDGLGSYLSAPHSALFEFGAAALTLECWLYPITSSGKKVIFTKRANSTDYAPFLVEYDYDTNKICVKLSTSGAAWEVSFTSATSLSPSAWSYIALVRDTAAPSMEVGTNVRLYINGELEAAAILTGVLHENTVPVTFGANADGSSSLYAYLDDIRFTKQHCRRTSSFQPPLGALPDTSMTVYDSFLLE